MTVLLTNCNHQQNGMEGTKYILMTALQNKGKF